MSLAIIIDNGPIDQIVQFGCLQQEDEEGRLLEAS
jgi:hypothetical protein